MTSQDLYTIHDVDLEGQKLHARISLNADHEIYSGHFPDTPVTPGVCQVNMVRDGISLATESKLYLAEAKSIKFLSMLPPDEKDLNLTLEYTLDGETYKVKSELTSGDKTFLKFSGVFAKDLSGK